MIKTIIKMTLCIACLLSGAGKLFAQNTFDALFDFNDPLIPDTGYTSNRSVYADTNLLLNCGFTFKNKTAIYLSALNYQGQLLWKKNLDFPFPFTPSNYPSPINSFNSLSKVSPNKYVLGGMALDNQIRDSIAISQPFIYFFTGTGDSILFVPLRDSFRSRIIQSTACDVEKNVILAGFSYSKKIFYSTNTHHVEPDSNYMWVSKFSENGNLLWERTLFPSNIFTSTGLNPNVTKVELANDNLTYIIAGYGVNYLENRYTPYILKIDHNGNPLWGRFIPDINLAFNTANGQDPNSNFDLVHDKVNGNGYYFSYNIVKSSPNPNLNGTIHLLVGKISETGHILWAKVYEHNDSLYYFNSSRQITQAANGDLFVLSIYSNGNPYKSAILHLDSSGNLICQKQYSRAEDSTAEVFGTLSNALTNITTTPDNRIFVGGTFNNNTPTPNSFFDSIGNYAWYMLLDSLGRRNDQDTVCIPPASVYNVDLGSGDTIPLVIKIPGMHQANITIYPNPTRGIAHINLNGFSGKIQDIVLSLFDITGKQLWQRNMKERNEIIDLNKLPPNMYLLHIQYGDQDLGSQKIIRE